MLYDGARAHIAKSSQTLIKAYFTDLKNVPYSCDFNSIERVWSVAKSNFHKRMVLQQRPLDREAFIQMVQDSLDSIDEKTFEGLFISNRSYIRSILEVQVDYDRARQNENLEE